MRGVEQACCADSADALVRTLASRSSASCLLVASVPFFVEYNTGSERLETLAEKIFKYASLRAGTTWIWPTLFVLPSQRREDNLHHWMTG